MMQRPRIIIVEGPDGAGKTTLVEYLARELGARSWHCGVPVDHPMIEYMDVAMVGLRREQTLIVDRFHLGEQVYGPIMRGGDRLGLRGRLVFEELLRRMFDPVIVLCLPPFNVCMRNWQQNHTNEYVKETAKFHDVWHAFSIVATSLPKFTYDYTRTTPATVLGMITQ